MARLTKTEVPESDPATPENPTPAHAPTPEPQLGLSGLADRIFGIDVRSMALFRIVLALIMIGDLLYRAQDLKAHYTDAGVLPIALVSVYQQQHWWWSIHSLHPALAMEVVLFLIAGLFSLSLLVGYRTRAASVVCWLLLISLQNRNVYVLTGGDTMLRVMAFWAMFLPLGTRWSIDRLLDKTDTPIPTRIVSIGSAAVVLQLGIIYLFGALLKTGPTWRIDHTAVYYALSIGQFATPLAKVLVHYPDMLKTLTFLAWNLEFLAPFLILASAFSAQLRTVVVLAYMGFHISLGLCLALGLFPLIGALTWLVLMPDWFWQTLFRLTARLPRPTFVTAMQTKILGWRERLRPQSVSTHTPRIVQVTAAVMLLYVVCWNVRMTNFTRYLPLFPVTWNWLGEITHMDQNWELFAPDPMKTQGWIVVEAELKNGEKVDLKTQQRQVVWTQPPLISETYYNERWRKYLMNLTDDPDQNRRFTYASYLGNRWNDAHPADQRVKTIGIYLMRSNILPDLRYSEPEKVEIFTGNYN